MIDKIPITANFRKTLFGMKDKDRELLLDASFSNAKFAIYAISRILKVYDSLDDEPQSPEEIAGKLGTQDYATRMLLDALTGFGLVGKKDGGYYTVPPSKVIKCGYRRHDEEYIRHNPFWSRFLKILKGEKLSPLEFGHEWSGLEEQVDFALFALCGEFNKTLDFLEKEGIFKRIRSFIDVGGGHGIYSIGFSKLYPHLEGAIFDFAEVLEITRLFLRHYGVKDKIRLIAGNVLKDELPGKFDMVFMSNVTFREKEAGLVFKKLYTVLNDHGVLVLKDIVPCFDWSDVPYALIHEIISFIEVGDISRYCLPPTMKEYTELMKKAGFNRTQILGYVTKGWTSLSLGFKEKE